MVSKYDEGDFYKDCIGCGGRENLPTYAGFPFCKACYRIYKDRIKEPWVRGLVNYNAVHRRSEKKYRMLTFSIEALEEAAEEAEESR